jgi:hypothetical protein
VLPGASYTAKNCSQSFALWSFPCSSRGRDAGAHGLPALYATPRVTLSSVFPILPAAGLPVTIVSRTPIARLVLPAAGRGHQPETGAHVCAGGGPHRLRPWHASETYVHRGVPRVVRRRDLKVHPGIGHLTLESDFRVMNRLRCIEHAYDEWLGQIRQYGAALTIAAYRVELVWGTISGKGEIAATSAGRPDQRVPKRQKREKYKRMAPTSAMKYKD